MPYEFFLSYARADRDVYLRTFFDELSEVVRNIRGLSQTTEAGFFDQRSIELSSRWDDTIVGALQTSNVLLPVASPGYFKSKYCGRELTLFQRRIAASVVGGPVPPLIKPIIWFPFDLSTVPASVKEWQLTIGDPHDIQNQRGFKYLIKNRPQYRNILDDLVEMLARQIVDAADRYRAQPLQHVTQLLDVPSAFVVTPPAPAGTPSAAPRTSKHPTVFLCYRRQDAQDAAGRLHDGLVACYGSERVFMDIDSVPLGIDFIDHVAEQISACSVVIVMIGKQWLKVKDKRRRRRLDNEDDLVRVEIAAALQQKVPVIPVLVQDAEMPSADDLPDNIRILTRRNGIELSASRWRADVERLIKELDRVMRA